MRKSGVVQAMFGAAALLASGNAVAQQLTTLFTFNGVSGAEPLAGMIERDGLLYGTTYMGLPFGRNVFQFDERSDQLTLLHAPMGPGAGSGADGGLTEHGGRLYGTTGGGGGPSNSGQVFAADPSTGDIKPVYDFQGGSDGEGPTGTVTFVGDTMHGTTLYGGGTGCFFNQGCGTAYSIDSGGHERVLHRFGGAGDGKWPARGLVYVGGLLYGLMQVGPTGPGAIYSTRTRPIPTAPIPRAGYCGMTGHSMGPLPVNHLP